MSSSDRRRSARSAVASIPLALGGCVSAGLASPDYAAHEPPQDHAPAGEATAADRPTPAALPAEPDLADLLRHADLHSPRLAAARSNLTAAEGRAWQAELWPNPLVRLEARDKSQDMHDASPSSGGGGHGGGSSAASDEPLPNEDGSSWVVLVQPLSVSGRRGASVAAARSDRSAAEEALEGEITKVRAEVADAWADAVFASAYRAETAALARAMERAAGIAAARVASGTSPELSTYEQRVAAEDATNAARAAEREAPAALERLRALVGAPAAPEAVRGGTPALRPLPARDEIRRLVAVEGPALRELRHRVEAAARRLDAERAARVPDVEVMVGFGRDDATDDGMVEAGLIVPLPVFDRNQGRIREAAAMLAAARSELVRAEALTDAEIVADAAQFAAARDRLASWRDRLAPAAERARAQVAASFAAGSRTESEWIAAEVQAIEARVELLRAERDAAKAENELRSHLRGGFAPREDVR